jgi:hypothetical protein
VIIVRCTKKPFLLLAAIDLLLRVVAHECLLSAAIDLLLRANECASAEFSCGERRVLKDARTTARVIQIALGYRPRR